MNLNQAQQAAASHIFGPLMVIAGPGTGKTELLSARAGEILKQTDTPAEGILCLTYTDAGTEAMQSRLIERLGQDGYKIPVHTFHSFAADIMNRYRGYFYNGAELSIADDLERHQILTAILDELPYDNPLKTSFAGEYTTIKDILSSISEIKRSGLSTAEFSQVLDNAIQTIDQAEPLLVEVFSSRISKSTLGQLESALVRISLIPEPNQQPATQTYVQTLVRSLETTIAEAAEHPKVTPPLTAWKNQWLGKDNSKQLVLKSRGRIEKLRALLPIIQSYQAKLSSMLRQDYDDMILSLIEAIELNDDLRYELQERFLFIMVDEFQDTNLAQMRIINNLTNNPASEGHPNLMVVGDDDQAIFSFQGAEVGNILTFQDQYPDAERIVLTDNYRSPELVLSAAEIVISQGEERLTNHIAGLSKSLTAHSKVTNPVANITAFEDCAQENQSISSQIAYLVEQGIDPSQIAVIAKQHVDLEGLLPYLNQLDIAVDYRRRENVLDSEPVKQLLLLAQIIDQFNSGHPDQASAFMPELLAHPAWQVPASVLWSLGLDSYNSHKIWLELLPNYPETKPFHDWLVETCQLALTTPLELLLDRLVGHGQPEADYQSPLKQFFFSAEQQTGFRYIDHLDNLLAIREALRTHYPDKVDMKLGDLLNFVDLAKSTKTNITRSRRIGSHDQGVKLMTAHGAKGLEFDHVFIINAIDSRWGDKARSKSSVISYPENLRLRAETGSKDERLRLFFVAMTRAKSELYISYAMQSDNGKQQLLASFLSDNAYLEDLTAKSDSDAQLLNQAESKWYQPLVDVQAKSLAAALSGRLEHYKLSATDLNAYLDVSNGGPQGFLINNLLRFPSAMSPSAAYGSAIHSSLQQAHNYVSSSKVERLPEQKIIEFFTEELAKYPLAKTDYEHYAKKGSDSLSLFLDKNYQSFSDNQLTEVGFFGQNVVVGEAKLTGNLDLVSLDKPNLALEITDYKTGKPFSDWSKGSKYDKLKSHHYSQQLKFYNLLVANSRDYHRYQVASSSVQFVEPDSAGNITNLSLNPSSEDLEYLSKLVQAVWQQIVNCQFPDTSQYGADVEGVKAFEDNLVAKLQ